MTRESKASKRYPWILVAVAAVLCSLTLVACGGGSQSGSADTGELKDLRELSWEGTELTVKLGTNKSTGCEWDNELGDRKVIDYSVNRKFTLSDDMAKKDVSAGTLSAGFQGQGAGTTTITFTTPKDWDGNEPGYTYVVTVEVAEDGTILDASGE